MRRVFVLCRNWLVNSCADVFLVLQSPEKRKKKRKRKKKAANGVQTEERKKFRGREREKGVIVVAQRASERVHNKLRKIDFFKILLMMIFLLWPVLEVTYSIFRMHF